MAGSNKSGGIKSLVSEIADGAVLLFGLIAFCMLFVSCVKLGNSALLGSAYAPYTGIQIVFGYNNVLGFSFMNFLPFFFVFVALVIVILNFFGAFSSFKDFDIEIVATALFLLATVLFFWSPKFVNITSQTNVFSEKKLGVGLIMAGVLSVLCALILGAKQTFSYLVKKGYISVSD